MIIQIYCCHFIVKRWKRVKDWRLSSDVWCSPRVWYCSCLLYW